MIFAYPERVCIEPGDTPEFNVTGAPGQSPPVRYFRCGARAEAVSDSSRSGVYIAAFGNVSGELPLDARSARALFVVRDPSSPARLLVVLPLFTYHAYNVAEVDGTLRVDEGRCLYSGAPWVSLERPGGGVGGHPWDEVNADAYDRISPRQTFAHWDAKGIAWLERSGYAYDCVTDVELHDREFDLSRYRAIVSFGHHEYWTDSMRGRLEDFVSNGGNVAFFGGNTCWFRADYDAARRRVRRIGRWSDNPEWRMTGVSYAYGGGKWIGERPPSGYRIVDPRHWLFDGLEVREGQTFGAPERLVGYECDGAPAESDLEVAAECSIRPWPVAGGSGEISEHARAALGVRRDGSAGMVFTASTVDWARVLACGEPIVTGITRNVMERFLAGTTPA